MHRFQHGHEHRARFARHGFGWGGDHEHHGPRGERGRRGRVFEQGDLRLLLLQLIAAKPSHGYELIKAVEDSVGGAYAPSPGVVYPTLTLLEDLGYLKQAEAEGKKLYAITPEGQAWLESQAEALASLNARVEQIATAGRGRNAPQLVRATENLRTALRLRLARGPLDEAQIEAVADALDAAAKAIERA